MRLSVRTWSVVSRLDKLAGWTYKARSGARLQLHINCGQRGSCWRRIPNTIGVFLKRERIIDVVAARIQHDPFLLKISVERLLHVGDRIPRSYPHHEAGLETFRESWALSPVPMSVADIDDDAGPPLTRRTPVVFWECTAKPCADIVCMFE